MEAIQENLDKAWEDWEEWRLTLGPRGVRRQMPRGTAAPRRPDDGEELREAIG